MGKYKIRKKPNVFERLKKKKEGFKTLNQMERETQKQGEYAMKVSLCPDHGPYTEDNLCPCYNKGGSHEGVFYGEEPLDWTAPEVGHCPVHGEVPLLEDGQFTCDCFDENGNPIPGWDRDL